MSVPNIVHFIYPAWESTRPLSYLNYVAVRLAILNQKPDEVWFWLDGDPVDNEWWKKIKPLVTIKRKEMRGEYGGTKIEWPQYQADVTRLEILRDHGGIYFDTDVLLMRSLDRFMDGVFTIGREPTDDSLSNATMISAPNDPFVNAWLNIMPEALKSGVWANGGVITPYNLARDWSRPIQIEPSQFFCPLDLKFPYLFAENLEEEAIKFCEHSYGIHVYETYWRDLVKDITPSWVDKNKCLFSTIVRFYGIQ